jgi:mRNA interferase RelE/StbE
MYRLVFRKKALKQWKALDASVRSELAIFLERRLLNPYVPGSRLRGELADCYKIKLRKAGIRLIYLPDGKNLVVTVISVGKREAGAAYRHAVVELEN